MKVKMNLVMKDPTTTATMTTAGNGWRVSPLPEGNGLTIELTRLLEKCQVMNERRDEEMIARICPTLTTDESD
jgi:hypothetical protein